MRCTVLTPLRTALRSCARRGAQESRGPSRCGSLCYRPTEAGRAAWSRSATRRGRSWTLEAGCRLPGNAVRRPYWPAVGKVPRQRGNLSSIVRPVFAPSTAVVKRGLNRARAVRRRQRPRRRAAEERDERAPAHSITLSARASRVDGTSRPSAFAVLRLMTSSNLLGR
jgi:hypothetical protein